jgi:hypothetical protein
MPPSPGKRLRLPSKIWTSEPDAESSFNNNNNTPPHCLRLASLVFPTTADCLAPATMILQPPSTRSPSLKRWTFHIPSHERRCHHEHQHRMGGSNASLIAPHPFFNLAASLSITRCYLLDFISSFISLGTADMDVLQQRFWLWCCRRWPVLVASPGAGGDDGVHVGRDELCRYRHRLCGADAWARPLATAAGGGALGGFGARLSSRALVLTAVNSRSPDLVCATVTPCPPIPVVQAPATTIRLLLGPKKS